MPVLSDKWIKENAKKNGMIKPFVAKQVRKGKISFGLSSSTAALNSNSQIRSSA